MAVRGGPTERATPTRRFSRALLQTAPPRIVLQVPGTTQRDQTVDKPEILHRPEIHVINTFAKSKLHEQDTNSTFINIIR